MIDHVDSARRSTRTGGRTHGTRAPRSRPSPRHWATPTPRAASAYERAGTTYTAELTQLDRYIATCLDRLAPDERKLVTEHDALGYYADRYGLEVIGAAIPALSTQAQPSAGDTAALVDQVEAEGVKAVFPEAGLNPRLQQAIADEADVAVGDQLWADTLGPEGSPAGTYVGAMRANTDAIADGLSGGRVRCRARGLSGSAAARAEAAQDHIVATDLVVQPSRDRVDRALEGRVLELADAAAAVADDVVVVLAGGVCGLVAGGSLTGVEPVDQLEFVRGARAPGRPWRSRRCCRRSRSSSAISRAESTQRWPASTSMTAVRGALER